MKPPYFLDSALLPCVTEIIKEDPKTKAEDIRDHLLQLPEFRRKNPKKFITSVEKAMDYVFYQMDQEEKKKKAAKKKSLGLGNCNSLFTNLYSSKPKEVELENEKVTSVRTDIPLAEEDIDKIEIQLPQRKLQNDRKIKSNPFKRPKHTETSDEPTHKKCKHNFVAIEPHSKLNEMKGVDVPTFQVMYAALRTLLEANKDSLKTLLVTGPSGSGKTMFAHCIASEAKASIIPISAADFMGDALTTSEMIVKAAFSLAKTCTPCILLIQNLDFLEVKEAGRGKNKIATQISLCIEALENKRIQFLVVGETSFPDKLDSSLRRCFGRELFMGALNAEKRLDILNSKWPSCKDTNLIKEMAEKTSGFTPGDLVKLVQTTRRTAVVRVVSEQYYSLSASPSIEEFLNIKFSRPTTEEYEEPEPILEDFLLALTKVTPALKREGFPSIPETSWEEVGGLEDIKRVLLEKIFFPAMYPEIYKMGLKQTKPCSVLLWGPPGCGKTLIAKAVANHVGISFMSVAGPELLNMYQGETEKSIREVFSKAAKVAPTVVFFDEIDSICPKRKSAEHGNKVSIVNTLLTEMDGINVREDVFVLASTNRPDVLDDAILRPGRFDISLYVGLPDVNQRVSIMEACTRKFKCMLAPDVNFTEIAKSTDNFSGADCASLCAGASQIAVEEQIEVAAQIGREVSEEMPEASISRRHYMAALQSMEPSVSPEELRKYQKFGAQFNRLLQKVKKKN